MVYNQQHSFAKFKDISDFKEISLDPVHKRLNDFHKKFTKLEGNNPQTKANEDLKAKFLNNAGDIFGELHYIDKEKYEEEKDALNEKDTKKFDYTKLRLTDDYEYESEIEKKETDKKLNRKEPPKKPAKNSVKKLSKLINKEETDMNWRLFQKHFKFTKPSALLKKLYCKRNKKENKKLVDLIKSALKDLKDQIKEMSENGIEVERQGKMVDLVQKVLQFNRRNELGQVVKILTPKQLITRLPILLAQLEAGNNSEKLKNEIRQYYCKTRQYYCISCIDQKV